MIFGISTTTINGFLALLITILTAVLSYQVPTALLSPQASRTWLYITAVCTFALGILRAVVGMLQNDAVSTPAIAAAITSANSGLATTEQVQAVLETPKAATAPTPTAAKLAVALLVAFLLVPMAGCKPAPLPQGAYTAPDAQTNEDLQAAHAALLQYSADVKNGTHVPTAEERVVVNKLIDAVNIADPAYQQYHAALAANPSAPEPAALIAALANVASNLSALEALIK